MPSPTQVTHLRAEYGSVDFQATLAPRLSWRVETERAGWYQRAYNVRRYDEVGIVIDEVRVESSGSRFEPWPFEPLVPHTVSAIAVAVEGTDGQTSTWSELLRIQAADLTRSWTAQLIALPTPQSDAQPFRARADFIVAREVVRATLRAFAFGLYQVELNGREIDDYKMKPGWTAYRDRVVYETTDVTALVVMGENVIGLTVAGGWFTEKYGFLGSAETWYGSQPSASAELVLEYANGTAEIISSDESWSVSASGPLRTSGIYGGERYDATREQPGWSALGYESASWESPMTRAVEVSPTPRTGPAVRATEELSVARTLVSPSGGVILDFGQNLVGHLRIVVDGPRGHQLTLRHAEVLEDGELCTRPLRYAAAVDQYVCSGDGPVAWEPAFTFHGFRYAQLDNWPGDFDPASITAVVVHSEMTRTGTFTSSHELLNKLHQNAVWSMRGNFLSIPTDCPQRDERLGWTGDIEVFAPTAASLYDCEGFLASWLEDLTLEQKHHAGVVPMVIPAVLGDDSPIAAWGDAATITPWTMYKRFGDVELIRRQYASMTDWVEALLARLDERGLWTRDFQLGDWLDPAAPPENPGEGRTDRDLVANTYLYRSLCIARDAAELIGREGDVVRYRSAAEAARVAFQAEYVTPGDRIVSHSATAYALAIVFDLVKNASQRIAFGARLASIVRESGYLVSTGFVGTAIVCDALSMSGHHSDAGRLLLQTACPSWLYPVAMGATTIWERWDSQLPDGTINPGEMTSFNHYALGAVIDWVHREVAGLTPVDPGYRTVLIAPRPIAGIDQAGVVFDSGYGPTSVSWKRSSGQVTVAAVIPPNTTASISLPDGSDVFNVGSGAYSWRCVDTIETIAVDELSMATDLESVITDSDAYDALVAAVSKADPASGTNLTAGTRWWSKQTVGAALYTVLNPAQLLEVSAAMKEFNSRR